MKTGKIFDEIQKSRVREIGKNEKLNQSPMLGQNQGINAEAGLFAFRLCQNLFNIGKCKQ